MKNALTKAGHLIAIGSVFFFTAYVWNHASEWPEVSINGGTIGIILALIALQIVVFMINALAWRAILAQTGSNILTLRNAVSVFFKSQFAKYIPGNVAQHIGRALLAKKHGINIRQTSLSILIEALWTIGCATVIISLSLSSRLVSRIELAAIPQSPTLYLLLAALALFAPAIILPSILRYGQRYFPAIVPPDLRFQPSVSTYLSGATAYLLSFLHLGISINLLATALFDQTGLPLFEAVGVCALAWIAGFITPGSPAGIGIRDTILLLALSPSYGPETAAALALAHRLLTALGDVTIYVIGTLLSRDTHTIPSHTG